MFPGVILDTAFVARQHCFNLTKVALSNSDDEVQFYCLSFRLECPSLINAHLFYGTDAFLLAFKVIS